MKWTASIKGITTFFLVIMCTVALGLGMAVSGDSAVLAAAIIGGGVLISVLSVGLVMVFCEISENIYHIRQDLEGNKLRGELKRQKVIAEGSWLCDCGARNKQTAKYCRSCGKTKD